MKEISDELYQELEYLGIIDDSGVRSYNVGKSNYHTKLISPWVVWRAYPELSSFDHDIIKRILRTKEGDSRRMDYEKIIHICNECIRAIDVEEKYSSEETYIVKEGNEYYCYKDFVIDGGDRIESIFTKGNYYKCEINGYLSADNGLKAYVSKEKFDEYFTNKK